MKKTEETLSVTGNTINNIAQENIKMDRQIKKVLACKPILAVILSEVVKECEGMSTEEIINCIEGEVTIEEDPLFPTEMLTGNMQEDYQLGEGMVRYDIKTYLLLPSATKPRGIKIIVDVEAQKDDTPGYDIVTRGVFYCCRMISAQLDTEFTVKSTDKEQYANIKKVYSIWICTETSNKKKNTIEKYSIKKEMLYGQNSEESYYDILTVIIINIGEKHDGKDTESTLLNVLNAITDENLSATAKIEELKKSKVHVTEQVKEGVEDMTSYIAGLIRKSEARGRAEGEAKGRAEGEAKGKEQMSKLIRLLLENNRNDEIALVVSDEEYQQKLLKEYNLED